MNKKKNNRLKIFTALIAPVLILLLFSACSVNKPESPSWETTWEVPLSNTSYSITEILEDLDDFELVTDSLGNPAFQFSEALDTFAIDNNLTVDGVSLSVNDSIGLIDIDPPSSANANTSVYDILPAVIVGFDVLPASFSHNQPLANVSNYSWMVVESGSLELSFTNTLDSVDIDSFNVTVIDDIYLDTIGVATFPAGLVKNQTKIRSIDLSGKTISNDLSMAIVGYTAAGFLNSDAGTLNAEMSFPSTITVSSARAETPAINITQSNISSIGDSTNITSSTISSGTLTIDIDNSTQLPFTVDITSANFQYNSSDLQINRVVNGGQSVSVVIDLADYNLIPTDSIGNQYVEVLFTADVPASAPSQNTVSANDAISVDVNLSTVTFGSITGQITPTSITIDPIVQNLDIPDGLDQARLTRAQMSLNLYNNCTVPADIILTIEGGGRTININDRIVGKSSPAAPALLTTISVDADELSNFLNPPPAQITISGEAIMNPDYEIATITSNDNFYGDVELFSPFALAISDTISVSMDAEETEIDGDSRPDNFRETFRYGAMDLEIESHLPLGVELAVYVSTFSDTSLIFTDPNALVLGPYVINPGITDSLGQVISSVISNIADSLDSDDISIFDNDFIYMAQKINLLPTDSAGAYILGTDNIRIKANARMQIRIGDNLWDSN